VIGRQTHAADFMGKAQAPEMLHGARLRGVGLRVEGGAGFGIDQQAAYIAPAQLDGQHQAARAAASDEDIDGERGGHGVGVQVMGPWK